MRSETEVMRFAPAPSDLSLYIGGFGHRRDERGGDVVIVLPETRCSIQLMLKDDYWLKEADAGAAWRRVPKVALWGPRLKRGYGFAARCIHAYGVALTPAGFRALVGRAPGGYVNTVADFGDINRPLASALANAAAGSSFEKWIDLCCVLLRKQFANAPAARPILRALEVLAECEGAPIAETARRLDLSERQFRRLFSSEFGAPPKTYERLLRFDRTLRSLHPRPWEAPAPEGSGKYADQAHLIREFCAIAEITPGAYIRNKVLHGDRILRSIVVDGVAPPGAS